MKVLTLRLGSLQTNCYIVYDREGSNCIVIDAADDAVFIAEQITNRGLNCLAIIATHGHFDHNLAAGELQLILANNQKPATNKYIPFYTHKDDLFLLKKMNESANYFLRYNPHAIIPKNIIFFEPKMFQVSGFRFQIFHTPGHTPGGICINVTCQMSNVKCNILFQESEDHACEGVDEAVSISPPLGGAQGGTKRPRLLNRGFLFSGDTLFKDGIGRYDFSYSDKEKLIQSVKVLLALPSDTIIYPGHGQKSTIANENEKISNLLENI